jgi:hypothetical protein
MKRTFVLFLLAACGATEDNRPLPCKEMFPASQTLSEPCCPDWGIDACGAGLFCAAFDGRKQETCYPEFSRRDGDTCTEDRQCGSNSCNTEAGNCRASPYARCDAALGCAPHPDGRTFFCNGFENDPAQCTGLQSCDEECDANAQCWSGSCNTTRRRCRCSEGDSCFGGQECSPPLTCRFQGDGRCH